MITEKSLKKEIFSNKIKQNDFIFSFFQKMTEEDYNRLPLCLKSSYKKGVYYKKYHNFNTGHQSHFLKEVIRDNKYSLYECLSQGWINGHYIEYDEKDECLYIVLADICTSNLAEGVKGQWEPYRIIKIYKNQTIFGTHGSIRNKLECDFVNYEKLTDLINPEARCSLLINRVHGKKDYEVFEDCVSKLFPKIVTLEINNIKPIRCLDDFVSFMSYKKTQKENKSKQKKIDELVKFKMAEPIFETKPSFGVKVSALSRVTDNICCLRTFLGDGEKFYEGGRIYVTDKEVIACKKNLDGKYSSASLSFNLSHWNFSLSYIEKNCIRGTRLEYIEDLYKNIRNKKRTQAIIVFLHYPLLGEIYHYNKKTKNFVLKIATSSSPKKDINLTMGKPWFSRKTLNSILGLSDYQLKVLTEDNMLDRLGNLKSIFLPLDADYNTYTNISFIDDKTFNKIYEVFKELQDKPYASLAIDCMREIYNLYVFEVFCNTLEQISMIGEMHLMLQSKRNTNCTNLPLNLYLNYLKTVRLLDDSKSFMPYFKDYDDLKKIHDSIVFHYNSKENKS